MAKVKAVDELLESASRDVKLQNALKNITVKYDEKIKKELTYIYADMELRSIFNALREEAKIEDRLSKSKDRKLCIKIPNNTVYRFLNDVFSPSYGSNWLSDKTILNKVIRKEELIKPWVIRKP